MEILTSTLQPAMRLDMDNCLCCNLWPLLGTLHFSGAMREYNWSLLSILKESKSKQPTFATAKSEQTLAAGSSAPRIISMDTTRSVFHVFSNIHRDRASRTNIKAGKDVFVPHSLFVCFDLVSCLLSNHLYLHFFSPTSKLF
jgi:hypothetical protein